MTEQTIQQIKSMQHDGEWSSTWITLIGTLILAGGAAAFFGLRKYGKLW